MITQEALRQLATQHQTSEFPNIVREYFQHLFLVELSKREGAEKLLFKGGTALRIVYGSPRFSEDLDFSMFGVRADQTQRFVEDHFEGVLSAMAKSGVRVELGQANVTTGGYFGDATFTMAEYQPVTVAINISNRNGRNVTGEVDAIANDFIPTYTLVHLPKEQIVEEKIFSALLERGKARDFYDCYFMLRKNMLTPDQKKRLVEHRDALVEDAKRMDFRSELGTFLPIDHQAIIADFASTLRSELDRQLSTS